jgi:hypothetical protein
MLIDMGGLTRSIWRVKQEEGKADIGGGRHDAQTCYCGEANCVGTIGGKTQTDVGTIDDLFLDGELFHLSFW